MNYKNKKAIQEMLMYANETRDFFLGITFEKFINNRMIVAACSFNLCQIGELIKDISEEITTNYDHVEWKNIKAFRNRIVHDYAGVKIMKIWQVIEDDLPELIIGLHMIIENEKPKKSFRLLSCFSF